jgi:hypothetical protein
MKEIRKIEKEKKKRKKEKKYKMDPGNHSGPGLKEAHGPPGIKTRSGIQLPLSPR